MPTSCVAQGKCKECIVEVTSGMELLAPPTEHEHHLEGAFRLSCQCRLVAETGAIECHTMRRGHMRIERHALNLPVSPRADAARSARSCATASRIVDRVSGRIVDESSGPIHGLAMDLGTTTVVVRLINLETGELVADASFENPQRFGGSDVMSRIHYDTEHTRQAAPAHARRLPDARDRGVSRRSADDLRSRRRRELDDARHVLPPERVFDRPDSVPVDHRDRAGRGTRGRRPA